MNLIVLQINIHSIKTKMQYVDSILMAKNVDVLCVSETFLDEDTPPSFYKNANYNKPLRRDRGKLGGGLLVYVRLGFKIEEIERSLDFETIMFSLSVENNTYNFISAYKPPSDSNEEFIGHLESLLVNVDPAQPLFIIGDLNMDLLSSAGDELKDFMVNNGMKNAVRTSTRIATNFYKKKNEYRTSSTLIDVILYNDHDLHERTVVLDCPFSDHSFVASSLKITKIKLVQPAIMGRSLSEPILEQIRLAIDALELRVSLRHNADTNWCYIKQRIVAVINKYAPLKLKLTKNAKQFPWIDKELIIVKKLHSHHHASWKMTQLATDHELYREYRSMYQSLNRSKIKEYFASQTQKDFKNTKKFWQFYSSLIKIKSDKSASPAMPDCMINNNIEFNGDDEISTMLNSFFTTISSCSTASHDECENFTADLFNKLKKSNKIKVPSVNFEFAHCDSSTVTRLLSTIDTSSGAGVSCIATKVIKAASNTLAPILVALFNMSIDTRTIPSDWKSAVVTPIYKNKGVKTDVNSYRGISVLPPVAKLFEKVLAEQIVCYLNTHSILSTGQHGFRAGHSCETALHQLVSELNTIRDAKQIAMLLFIDFRKAFDLVDSRLLIFKLFHYGFGNNALKLIESYFSDRQQQTKVGKCTSLFAPISLGVPQGSVLGPLFFLLFINDLAFYLDDAFKCIMFADDTTLYKSGENMSALISKFSADIHALQEWCESNRIDINWSKTFIMFVTNKRIKPPMEIAMNGSTVAVVTTFKLLGVTLDNKLKFDVFTSELKRKIVAKMYTIKKLFQLCFSVKLQFFKTFMLPFFDYCSSLAIYYSKTAIQRMCNCFNLCLRKLFKIKNEATNNDELNIHNNKLEQLGLFNFEHRLVAKLATFVHKIINEPSAPSVLKVSLKPKSVTSTMHLRSHCQNTLAHKLMIINSRHKNALSEPLVSSKAGSSTFTHFFAKFVNNNNKRYQPAFQFFSINNFQ